MLLRARKFPCQAATFTLQKCRLLASQSPRRRWSDEEQDRFLLTLQERLGLGKDEDWLTVSRKDVLGAGGRGLLRRHGDSWRRVLHRKVGGLGISEVDCVKRVPRGHWDDLEKCRLFLESTRGQLGVVTVRDWAKVPRAKLADAGGRGLVAKFGNMGTLLKAVFPEEDWSHAPVPSSHWDQRENRKKRMEEIGSALGVKEPDDWRKVTRADVQRAGGGAVLNRYASFYDALVDCCLPEDTLAENVLQYRPQAPAGYWGDPHHVRLMLQQVRSLYRVRTPSDWYRISRAQIEALPKGKSLLSRMSLVEALRLAYPTEQWNEHACGRSDKRASQRWLYSVAQGIYEGCEVLEEVRLAQIAGSCTTSGLELDVYVPDKKLALEYQGRHHYEHLPFFGPVEEYSRRDKAKAELCSAAGIRLVEVPYWWNNEEESLLGSLYATEPALVPARLMASAARASPIAKHPPLHSRPVTHRRTKGSLMCPTFDGVRAVWSGTELSSTSGRRFNPPRWWLDSMPSSMELEGELYMPGRPGGGVGAISSLMRADPADFNWRNIKFHALDVIDVSSSLEQRIHRLQRIAVSSVVHVSEVEHCEGGPHVAEALRRSTAVGAAGVLLRDPKSFSRVTTSSLWKERTAFMASATVVSPSPSSRYVLVERDGLVQAVRCSQQQYESPPPSGSAVSVVHYGSWSSGRMRYPYLA